MALIPVNKPIIGEEEKKAVLDVVSSGMLVNASYEGGAKVREFEGKVKGLVGTKHVIAVNSGTAALHSVLMALGIKRGDEVIVPSFTFLATANVVLACGAKPVFVDIKEDYNMDPAAFRKAVTRKTRAVIPVHVYGYPADMDEIREVAASRSIRVVEDAAESLGATYHGTQTGKLSDAGCFSLYATKVVTSGEGGAISTDDDELADKLRLVRNHGQVHGYDSKHLGFNYRMPEMCAALASVQMDKLDGFLRARAKNAKRLGERIAGVKGAKFTQDAEGRAHVFYLYTLRLRRNRDKVQQAMGAAGVAAAVYWPTPVHRTPLYRKLGYAGKRLPMTDDSAKHVLSIPVHPGLTPEEVEKVGDAFLAAAREHL
ncbi:MAG: DegT/DnrJ/EryC1/StrS family aminotransferase [Nitrososphaerota archaeon]|nr:DegT/DnrJ/EryC1/StrS family aminotransferase [Nitrososphaerota archaeon]MDG6961575.1 DegT/DnrJ/EryC1/StrS family aminotransferase [Nitrososphaerota archaeon]MDG7015151.1 DegT/DnrJ/EryC1/StrS family aminotransferase [Nitrososphaerota archaeon]WGO49914.1 MAG: DegT/DnrJ/EryC1/StrS family aminotransferase [Nitrososphaerota archaeon]